MKTRKALTPRKARKVFNSGVRVHPANNPKLTTRGGTRL